MHDVIAECTRKAERGIAGSQVRRIGIGADQTASGRGGDEHHAQEHETAAQKNGREKLVLQRSQPVAEHAQEPHERNAGKGH
jgi:hypothetical protein